MKARPTTIIALSGKFGIRRPTRFELRSATTVALLGEFDIRPEAVPQLNPDLKTAELAAQLRLARGSATSVFCLSDQSPLDIAV